MYKYHVVIEKSETGFSAFSPDFPGCITVGDTVEVTIVNMREAIELYFEAAAEGGQDLPVRKYRAAYPGRVVEKRRNNRRIFSYSHRGRFTLWRKFSFSEIITAKF